MKQTYAVVGGVTFVAREKPRPHALVFYSYLRWPLQVLCEGSGCRVSVPFLSLLRWSTIVAHQCFSPVLEGVVVFSLVLLLTAELWTRDGVLVTSSGLLCYSTGNCVVSQLR